MYTTKDRDIINGRIRKYLIILLSVLAVLIAVFCVLIAMRLQFPAMAVLCMAWCWTCFMALQYVYPCVRYRLYLRDLQQGLSRVIVGTVEKLDDEVQEQDGCLVRTVHVVPDDDAEGRMLYVDVDKLDFLPKPGTHATLHCFGRHIYEVEA